VVRHFAISGVAMHIPDGDVDDLAKGLLFLLGHADKSKKWMLVRASVEKIQAGRR
jgi:hypothetical protein